MVVLRSLVKEGAITNAFAKNGILTKQGTYMAILGTGILCLSVITRSFIGRRVSQSYRYLCGVLSQGVGISPQTKHET